MGTAHCKKLAGAGAADDTELLAAANALMELVDQTSASSGKYNVTIKNSTGVQVGGGHTQFNKFRDPAPGPGSAQDDGIATRRSASWQL